jgi:hypothetical protein
MIFFFALTTVIMPASVLMGLVIFSVRNAMENHLSQSPSVKGPASDWPAAVTGADRQGKMGGH